MKCNKNRRLSDTNVKRFNRPFAITFIVGVVPAVLYTAYSLQN